MSLISRAASLLRRLAHRRRMDDDLHREVQDYFNAMVDRYVAQGLSRDEARRQARLRFGGTMHVEQEVREARTGFAFETAARDLRYAGRVLWKSPGFTATAILVLGIGIGAASAAFTAVYSVLLQPLHYRQPERLVTILTSAGGPVSPADYLDYRKQSADFEAMEAAQAWGGVIETADRAEFTPGLQVSAGMMAMLGVRPERGRLFRGDEDQPGAQPVILIGHEVWKRRLGGDPFIVGRTIRVGRRRYTVIGIMPPGFQFAPFWQTEAQIWIPFDMSSRVEDRFGRSLRLFARLRPGLSVEQARAEITGIAARLEKLYPASNTGVSASVTLLQEKVTGPVRPMLALLLATAVFVLLIACTNIANLLLSRSVGRRREIAVRVAIGATRRRILFQFAVESVLLATAGAVAGILLAWRALVLLSHTLPVASLPRQGEIAMQPWVLAFAGVVALAAGLLTALFPAFEATRVDVNEALKDGSRASTSRGQFRLRGFLVTAEVALALLLLVCAGLTIRTLLSLSAVKTGFDSSRLITMQVFASSGSDTSEKRNGLFQRVNDALASLPEIEQASAINHLPLSGDVWNYDYRVPGRPAPQPGHEPSAIYRVVRPGYFSVMKIPLLHGREFSPADRLGSMPVIVINEALAAHQWPGVNPVGRSLYVNVANGEPGVFTIVGIAANSRQSDWTGDVDDEFYLPYLQQYASWGLADLAFVARTHGDPQAALASTEGQIRRVAPMIAISKPATMEQVISDKLWRPRLTAVLLGVFAGIAVILAGVGIYGVVAYSVQRRAQEIGIRIALGATRAKVLGLVLRGDLIPVFTGLVIGVVAALLTTRWLASLLYGVKANDLFTFASVTAGLTFVAIAAIAIPVWRVARGDVLASLRTE